MLRIASSASSLCASPRECCVQIHPSIYLWNAFRCARVIVFCAACPFLADVEEIPLSAAARIFSRACGLVQGTALLWWRRRRWRLWRQGLCRSWEACTLLETTCALIFRRHVTLKLDIALRSDSCRSHCNIHTHTHTHTHAYNAHVNVKTSLAFTARPRAIDVKLRMRQQHRQQ